MTTVEVLGLDLSLTSTGFSGLGRLGTVTPKSRGAQRLHEVSDSIEDLIADRRSELVVVLEGYSFASRNSQAHAIGELGGVVRLTLYRAGIPYVEVPPTCRAKFATGRGNASKNEVISAISARTGIVWSGKGADDEVDAWILEEMGLSMLGRSRYEWPKTNTDALAKVDWSPLLNMIEESNTKEKS